jgi:hypothetical protein
VNKRVRTNPSLSTHLPTEGLVPCLNHRPARIAHKSLPRVKDKPALVKNYLIIAANIAAIFDFVSLLQQRKRQIRQYVAKAKQNYVNSY